MKQHYKIVMMVLMTIIIATSSFAQAPMVKKTSSVMRVVNNKQGQERPENLGPNATAQELSSNRHMITANDVIYVNGATPETEIPQAYVSFPYEKESYAKAERKKAEAEGESQTRVNISVDTEGFEYMEYVLSVNCQLYSKSLGLSASAQKENPDWNFDAPLFADVPAADDYLIVVQIFARIPDFKGDGQQYGAYIYSFAKDVQVSGESVDVTIKLSDACYNYEFAPVGHDGNTYPLGGPANTDKSKSTLTEPSLNFFNITSCGLINFGNSPIVLIAPSLDETCSFSGKATLTCRAEPYSEYVTCIQNGPFDSNFVLSNNPENFTSCNGVFQLTPKDKECKIDGAGFVKTFLLVDPKWGPSTETLTAIGGSENPPYSEVTVYTCEEKKDDESVETILAPQTRTFWNFETLQGDLKVAGSYSKDKDGKDIIVDTNYYINADGVYTFTCPVPEFNIDPSKQDIVNFNNSLFASSFLNVFGSDEMDTIWEVSVAFEPRGYFNEYVNLGNPAEYVEEIKYNGNEVSLEELEGYPYKNADYEVTLVYDNVCVEGEFQCDTKVTLGVNTRTEDVTSPQLANFQVRDEDGRICTRIPVAKKGTLYVGVQDDTLEIESIEISVAPNGSEDFKPLTADVVACKEYYGSYATADLSGLAHDTFYTVKVLAKDKAGNYSENTIYYAFNITDEESGVKSIAVGNNSDVEYYNLQGMRVGSPEAGQIYIVKRGNQVYKEVYSK